MKLKTLLLGSAAAMIAVSGARAADAVIAEPEAVEYVRVCDLYGSGFYYIPGTETCLKFSGYVRVDFTYDSDGVFDGFDMDGNAKYDDGSRWDYRARFHIDARNETDYGTLRSQIRIQGDGQNGSQGGDADAYIDRALIELGGLRFGYSDSYQTTVHGYGLPVEKYDGYFGYDQATMLDYTFAAGSFGVTVGVQVSGPSIGRHVDPEYYIGAAYSGDLFNAAVSYLYEDEYDNGILKASVEVEPFDGMSVKGYYMTSEIGDGGFTRTLGNSDWAWGVGASYQFADTLALRGGYTDKENEEDYFVVGLNWAPVAGLNVIPEVQIYADGDLGQEYSLRVYRKF